MPSKKRKELTLPPNFCASHYREMEKFLSQQPCLNPPRQRDSFTADDADIHSTEDLARFCTDNHITQEMLEGDPILPQTVPGMGHTSNPDVRTSQWSPVALFPGAKGKEKLENATRNMSADPRPPNTAVRRRQTSSQSKMVEVTETQGKQIATNMQKLSDMEERKVLAVAEIAEKQLQYFKIRDSEIAITQRGLVQAVTGLLEAIAKAYTSRSNHEGADRPPQSTGGLPSQYEAQEQAPAAPPIPRGSIDGVGFGGGTSHDNYNAEDRCEPTEEARLMTTTRQDDITGVVDIHADSLV
jgi:hypothetical protein